MYHSAMAVCVACERSIDPATGFIREHGMLCPACNLQQDVRDDQQRLVDREVAAEDDSLGRQAGRAAWVHSVIWGVLVILLAGTRTVWFSVLFPAAIVLSVAMAARRRWALHAALTLDAAALIEIFMWRLFRSPFDDWLIPLAFAALAALQLLLLWSIRRAFQR